MDYYKNLDLVDIKYFCEFDLIEKIELWKDVNGYDGIYKASTLGRIKSSMYHNGTHERILRQHTTRKGYLGCGLYKNKIRSCFLVHRLVAYTYLPNPDNLPEVNHKKGIKTDNRPLAIEWSTRADNIDHAVEHSLMQKGESCHKSKLKERQVLEIRASDLDAETLASIYNISKNSVWQIKRKATWAHI